VNTSPRLLLTTICLLEGRNGARVLVLFTFRLENEPIAESPWGDLIIPRCAYTDAFTLTVIHLLLRPYIVIPWHFLDEICVREILTK
jgi:hypothetical protein